LGIRAIVWRKPKQHTTASWLIKLSKSKTEGNITENLRQFNRKAKFEIWTKTALKNI